MPLGDVVCHHYCSGSGSWHRPTNLLFKRLGDPQAFGVVIIRRKCRFEDYVQQQSPRAVLDMSCGGHVRSNTTHQCVHRYCAPPAGFGVTISTIVSFTCVLGHSRTVSHGAYCVEADPSSPVLVKASYLINVGSQGRWPLYTRTVWSTITGLTPCAFRYSTRRYKRGRLEIEYPWP
jgi:hypothetical protein